MPALDSEASQAGSSELTSKIDAIPSWSGFLYMDLEFGGNTMK
jgi:hypothetical protein